MGIRSKRRKGEVETKSSTERGRRSSRTERGEDRNGAAWMRTLDEKIEKKKKRRRKKMIFFFNDTATTEIYTLSLHDALPISYVFLFF